jgi:tRNA pseudouridine32 synthase/23S rRNA pseudouridine746 synthase
VNLPILFSDDRFVVIDKPAGLPVHPGRGGQGSMGGPSVEDIFPALSRRRTGPWLAHRLDTDTAGCLVIALRRAPLLLAQAAFAAGTVAKTYWAVVAGTPAAPAGTIRTRLAKRQDGRAWRMAVAADGQDAVTDWRLRGTAGGTSWLECRPRTGRTHQIRVHCAHLGHPILGDPVYSDPVYADPVYADPVYGGGNGRLMLLARAISLPLDPPVAAVAPPPEHMRAALRACGWDASARD